MNTQQKSIRHGALGWVKKSIDDNLAEIKTDLKLFIEEGDEGLLKTVKEQLGLIQGVLMMVEQYGAAMLTEEMLSLASFIIENKKERSDQTLEILLRAVLQLPDYLEHIQSGHRDVPIAILPLLNDIRAAKNQDLFSEKLLFLPDLSMHSESAEGDSIDKRSNQASKLLAKKLRPVYQLSLLKIIKEEAVEENLKRMEKVCATLEEKSYSEQVARIWWIIGALIESVSRQQLELGVSIKSLLGKVDALFRVILIIGESGLLKRQPVELIKNFLYYIAQPECDGPKAQAIKTAYRLEQFLPSEANRSKLLDNIAGPNQELLKTVAEAMKVDIESVKSTLEVYVNSDPPNVELLKDIPQELHVISDTLAMIGLGPQRQLIESQIVSMKEVIAGDNRGGEEKLLLMATELIQVEQALDLMQKRQPFDDGQSSSESNLSKDYELDGVLSAVVTAALDDIQKSKSAILDFINDSTRSENIDLCITLMEESRGALELLDRQQAVAVVDGLIHYLKEHDIVEFMDTARLEALSQVVVSLEYYLEALGERISDADSILEFADTQLQDLLSTVTPPGEITDEEELVIIDDEDDFENELTPGPEPVLEVESDESPELEEEASTSTSIEGVESTEVADEVDTPLTEAQVSADADRLPADTLIPDEPEAEIEDLSIDMDMPDSIEFEAESHISSDLDEEPGDRGFSVEEPVSLETEVSDSEDDIQLPDGNIPDSRPLNVVPVSEESEVLVPGSDPDILEIYLEEAEEEGVNVARLHQDWLLHVEDENAIKNIRRAFHTIKGSGRLVGALKIAEFAWDYEQLLNRVIEKTILPSDEIIDAVGQAAIALPELVEELKTDQKPTVDIAYLRGLARALSEFKAEQVMTERTGIMEAISESSLNRIAGEGDNVSEQEIPEVIPEPDATVSDELVVQDADNEDSLNPMPLLEDPPDPLVTTTEDHGPGKEVGERMPDSQEESVPTDLSFDPELLTIYHQEVESYLSIINSALDISESRKELIPSEDFYRALHTIHGASRTADIDSIGELAGLMEKPLKSALSQSMALDQEVVTLYRRGYQALESMTNELVETRQLPEAPEDLKISLIALAEELEEHTVELPDDTDQPSNEFVDTLTMMGDSAEDEQDNELLGIFVDEAKELLEMSDHTLHTWVEQEPNKTGQSDFSAVMELQRYLHTLKGGAKMAELNQIGDLSHELESMFIGVIDTRVEKSNDLIELLRDSFDLLHKQVDQAEKSKPISNSSEQIQLLKNLRYGDSGSQPKQVEVVSSEPVSEEIDIVSEIVANETTAAPEQQAQEVVRVRSELLDNLVSSAGEVSMYRARMEQQVTGLGSYLGELGQTISRLKNQLRNLEAETDAQIHFSHRADTETSGEFDPLEMDRYTLIQELSRSLGESVNDLSSLQNMLGEQVKDSETLLLQQSRVNTDLQDGLIKSRMVKFSGLLSRLRRLVRQSSQELGKKATLVVSGEENEVDNKVLDRMVAPLEHIIRNALSHGIETPVDRARNGKAEIGVITIDISRDGSDVVIRVSDDGGGINLDKVRSRALQLGLMKQDHGITDSDLVQFVLVPGFSTAESVTQVSGRGVGMDVVDTEIKQLGGTLQIETSSQGTSFVARLPFTLSINQAILVRIGDESYAIPLINIEGITRIESQKLVEHYQSSDPEVEYGGQRFALHYLSQLLGASENFNTQDDEFKHPVILSRSGDVRVALHVDEILGNREIVVKALGKQLSQVKGLSGASILADGSVVLILDINGVVRQGSTSGINIIYKGSSDVVEKSSGLKQVVMVVDDSITMRRVASKLLERYNYKVVTAKDGVDALAQLEDVKPDVMLLDVEMPRMDGFELATRMQGEAGYSKIPIIMITSRTGEKHRDRAFEIGVTNYMGKPYQEDALINNIQSAIAG